MTNPNADPLAESLLESTDEPADTGLASANIKLELTALSLLSAPVIVQLGALYAIPTVNQYFIGHLGAAPLAAAAIGNTVRRQTCGSATNPLLSLSQPSTFKLLFPLTSCSWSALSDLILCVATLQWFNFCWYFLLGVSTALDTLGEACPVSRAALASSCWLTLEFHMQRRFTGAWRQ